MLSYALLNIPGDFADIVVVMALVGERKLLSKQCGGHGEEETRGFSTGFLLF